LSGEDLGVLTLQKADRDAEKQVKLMRWHHFICKQLRTCQQISAESAWQTRPSRFVARVEDTPNWISLQWGFNFRKRCCFEAWPLFGVVPVLMGHITDSDSPPQLGKHQRNRIEKRYTEQRTKIAIVLRSGVILRCHPPDYQSPVSGYSSVYMGLKNYSI
jgi:hypothetical protein